MAQCLIQVETLLTEICGRVLDVIKCSNLPSEAKFIVIFLTLSSWLRGRYSQHLQTNKQKEKGKERNKERRKEIGGSARNYIGYDKNK
jgi:hypothetical protein